MRVFVAGATGVLGRRVVDRLVADDHEVTAVSRSPGKDDRLRRSGAAPVRLDLFDSAAVAVAVAGHDAVLNLATAIPPVDRMALRRAWHDNDRLRSEASRVLVDAALSAGAGRYVQESITFLYADQGDRWIDESGPVDAAGVTATAGEAEAQAARFTSAGGVGVALRFAQFVASDSSHLRDLLPIIERGWLPLVGDHDGYESYVDADDAAAAVVAALDAPAGVYNVADDEPLTRREHAAVVSEAVGRPVRLPPSIVGALPPLRVKARSQRIVNRSLTTAVSWRPRRASMREGWPAVLSAVREEARRAA